MLAKNAHLRPPDRLNMARSVLSENRAQLSLVSHDARVLYAVGLLICDENGVISRWKLRFSMRNPLVLARARALVSEVF